MNIYIYMHIYMYMCVCVRVCLCVCCVVPSHVVCRASLLVIFCLSIVTGRCRWSFVVLCSVVLCCCVLMLLSLRAFCECMRMPHPSPLCCLTCWLLAGSSGNSRWTSGARDNPSPGFQLVGGASNQSIDKDRGLVCGIFRTPSFWTLGASFVRNIGEPSTANSCWLSESPGVVILAPRKLTSDFSLNARVRKQQQQLLICRAEISRIFYVKMDLGSRGSCSVFRSLEKYRNLDWWR